MMIWCHMAIIHPARLDNYHYPGTRPKSVLGERGDKVGYCWGCWGWWWWWWWCWWCWWWWWWCWEWWSWGEEEENDDIEDDDDDDDDDDDGDGDDVAVDVVSSDDAEDDEMEEEDVEDEDRARDRAACFVWACAAGMHIEPVMRLTLYENVQEKCPVPEPRRAVCASPRCPSRECKHTHAHTHTPTHTHTKRMSWFHKGDCARNFTGERLRCRISPERGRTLCTSLHRRNACQQFTRATLKRKFRGEMPAPKASTLIKHWLFHTYTVRAPQWASVWIRSWEIIVSYIRCHTAPLLRGTVHLNMRYGYTRIYVSLYLYIYTYYIYIYRYILYIILFAQFTLKNAYTVLLNMLYGHIAYYLFNLHFKKTDFLIILNMLLHFQNLNI